jgi:hypothetical protein
MSTATALCRRHPQYAAFYKWLEQDFGADAVLHFGMHGTVEWVGRLHVGSNTNRCSSAFNVTVLHA